MLALPQQPTILSLKCMLWRHDSVENTCFEFDIDTLTPTYNLMIGVPGQSNAFEISQKIGLKHTLIDRARGLLSSQKNDFTKIANKLEMLRKRSMKITYVCSEMK